ncbi:MAG: hypothetical protein EPN21_05275 [Methylococcaceae bacterium]|nr:MAG: hypothetical protein EPN21_05275 [Methylococcaceae bacterium]
MSLLTIKGIYENGQISLEETVPSKKTISVIVTFLEEKPPGSKKNIFSSFNFKKSQQLSATLKTSLTDALIEERRKG